MYNRSVAGANLPEEVLDRFRGSSRDRLARIEAVWSALSGGVGSEDMASEMHRNVHTLKGDARLVGFDDVNLVCQKLEDLLALAADLRYHAPDELDFAVTMAVDFVGILLKRRGAQQVAGIDLAGFVRQVDEVIGSIQSQVPAAGDGPGDAATVNLDHDLPDRMSGAARARLADAATQVFLEYLSASGSSRTRLRRVWRALQSELERVQSSPLGPVLERHAAGAPDLADSLGKRVAVTAEVQPELRVRGRAVEAVEVALLHVLRNAVDHGIEEIAARRVAGKPDVGAIRIVAAAEREAIEIRIEDDGRGVDLEDVRRRSVALGLMHPDLARKASAAALLDVLFQPRFSTRERPTDLSGRGVGLDAVKSAITQAGGSVSLATARGRGTQVSIRVPLVVRRIEVFHFAAYGGRIALAVPATWAWHLEVLQPHSDPIIEPLSELKVAPPSDETGLSQSGPPKALCFRSGAHQVRMVAGTSPKYAMADRICPTDDDDPAEVVAIEGAEVLLIRPDRLPGLTNDSNQW